MNVVITGANRGLGLGLVCHYLAQGDAVWAGHRAELGELAALAQNRLHPVPWDVCQPLSSLDMLPEPIDLLINNAGIYGPGKDAQSLEQITPQVMMQLFETDCVAALMVVQQLRARFATNAIIANMSSKMGSITDNSSGGTYAYRAAKAALVMVSKSLAVDLAPSGIHLLTLHPGWVRTDMTQHTGLMDIADSVAGLTSVLAQAHNYEAGSFISFDGQTIPY
ncbi:MAG: SDR family oxidoreductase [Mariprofundales bacterium]|nr:SDR family oxidoreductase [Mariprofundales bacterium]